MKRLAVLALPQRHRLLLSIREFARYLPGSGQRMIRRQNSGWPLPGRCQPLNEQSAETGKALEVAGEVAEVEGVVEVTEGVENLEVELGFPPPCRFPATTWRRVRCALVSGGRVGGEVKLRKAAVIGGDDRRLGALLCYFPVTASICAIVASRSGVTRPLSACSSA